MYSKKKINKSLCKTVHPYAGELLIISVLFQIDQMSTKGYFGTPKND